LIFFVIISHDTPPLHEIRYSLAPITEMPTFGDLIRIFIFILINDIFYIKLHNKNCTSIILQRLIFPFFGINSFNKLYNRISMYISVGPFIKLPSPMQLFLLNLLKETFI